MVKVQQTVTVTVLEVDLPRRRIALSMKTGAQPTGVARGFRSPAEAPPKPYPAKAGEGGSPAKNQPQNTPFSAAFADAFGKGTKE